MTPTFVDCQGLAGAWSLGTAQAGFELIHRVSLPGGFGDAAIDANRHLVGDGWVQEVGVEAEWTPQVTDYVCGTPPCSGFSLLNSAKGANARGKDSTINQCMKELATYGAHCFGTDGKRGAQVISFESVQGAYTEGRPLMLAIRDMIEDITGQKYTLTHVKMSGSSVGAAQFRRRYYPVFHRIPFGVDAPLLENLPDGRLVTYGDAIGDLEGAALQWEPQPYPRDAACNFQDRLRNGDGTFTDHVPLDYKKKMALIERLYKEDWPLGMGLQHVCVYLGIRPPEIDKAFNEETGRYKGFSWPRRIRPDRPGYVITGSSGDFLHWEEPRSLTIRELSRIMGYPDAWVWPYDKHKAIAPLIGKCCPVDSGRWISTWIRRAIEEDGIGTDQEQIGRDEYLHNSTNAYKAWPGADVPPVERGLSTKQRTAAVR